MEARELRNRLVIILNQHWSGEALHDEFGGEASIDWTTESGERFIILVMRAAPPRGEAVSAKKEDV